MQNRDEQKTLASTDSTQTKEEKELYPPQLIELANKKKIDYRIFQTADIELKDDITKHAAWAFKSIYSIPYPNKDHTASPSREEKQDIARIFHGIQHVCRAAMYIPVFANLYRKYDDDDAHKLSAEDIQLLQIAVLFHDSAREDEDVDRWDHESALLLYFYLTRVLKISHDKAKLLTEAVANKDAGDKDYKELKINEKNELVWQTTSARPKNIYQKLIHDADCLDIIRARDHFDAKKLDFYNQFATHNASAFDEMAYLIIEARSIIESQGDGRGRTNNTTKKLYEHENAYSAILSTLKSPHFQVLPQMYAEGKLLSKEELQKELLDKTPYDKMNGFSEKNLMAALREGKIIARSITTPSAIRDKKLSKMQKYGYEDELEFEIELKGEIKDHPEETLAELEIRKMKRRPGVPTRTNKYNNKNKNGNPNRSFSLLGWGGSTYGDAGFLIIDPDMKDIRTIASIDSNSGRHKKKTNEYFRSTTTPEQKVKEIQEVIRNQKMGGSSIRSDYRNFPLTHNEITYDISDFSAVYFSNDPNFFNADVLGGPYPGHAHAPALEAIYLQKEYERAQNKTIPILEYSGIHNFIKPIEYTPEQIQRLWLEMCSDFMKKRLSEQNTYFYSFSNKIWQLAYMPVDDIKTLSMYKTNGNNLVKCHAPADVNYDPELRKKITESIEAEKARLVSEYKQATLKNILETKTSVVEDTTLFFGILNNVELLSNSRIREKIIADIEQEMKADIQYPQSKSYSDAYIDSVVSIIQSNDNLRSNDTPLSRFDNFKLREVNSTKILKIYAMAELVQHQGYINKIKEIAIAEVKKQISEKGLEAGINNLMKIISQFKIYPELKAEMESLAYKAIQAESSEVKGRASYWPRYASKIRDMKKLNLLNNDSKQEIKECCKVLCSELNKGQKDQYYLSERYFENAKAYLDLSESLDIPISERREIIIESLLNCQFKREKKQNGFGFGYGYGYGYYESYASRHEDQVDVIYKKFFQELKQKLSLDHFKYLKDYLDPTTTTSQESRQESLKFWLTFTSVKFNKQDLPWIMKLCSPLLSDKSIFGSIIKRLIPNDNIDEFQQQIDFIKQHVANKEFTEDQMGIINSEKSYLLLKIRDKEEKLSLAKKNMFSQSAKKGETGQAEQKTFCIVM